MKKFLLSLTLVLSSFFLMSSVSALSDYYVYNEDVSSPNFTIVNTLDNFVNRFFTVSNTTFTTVSNMNAWYCMFYYDDYSTPSGVCATRPFVHAGANKVIYSDQPFYAIFFYNSSNTPYISKQDNASEVSSGVYSFSWSGTNPNNQKNFIYNFHMSDDYEVNGVRFINSFENKKFISVYKKYDTFTGQLDAFTYGNDKQQDKYSKFMTVFENQTNASYHFTYQSGFMYYNNTIFRFDENFELRNGYPSDIQTQYIVPIIYQYNEVLSFPYYDGTTTDYTRLYLTNDNLGQVNGIYTFYIDVTDYAYCTWETIQGVWTGTCDYDLISFTLNEAPVIPGEDEGATNDDINNSINDINNNIMDDTPPDVDASSDLVGLLPPGPVDSILNMPLSLMRSMVNDLDNGTCTPISLPLPFVHQNLTLPCLSSIYSQINGLSTFLNWLGYIASGWILYAYFSYVYNNFDKLLSLSSRGVTIAKWGSDV